MVEIFVDCVEIASPGGVCKGITPVNFDIICITRNPLVQNMYYRIDYIEQMGTGIMRIKDEIFHDIETCANKAGISINDYIIDILHGCLYDD